MEKVDYRSKAKDMLLANRKRTFEMFKLNGIQELDPDEAE